MKKREAKILELLVDHKTMTVAELSEIMGVSEVTIRKDLDHLEKERMIFREHGYARLNETDNMALRLAQNYATKLKLAKKAAEEVEDGEIIIIESGSCCALLAKEISKTKSDVTIITNSSFIASYLKSTDTKIILLGGSFQPEAQVTVGPILGENLKRFHVTKAFIGTDGFSPDFGFTANDFDRAQAVKEMANRSDELIIITDSTKFGRKRSYNLVDPRQVDKIITDEKIKENFLDDLKEKEILVQIV